jgi:putative peptidoglycan lipid II flippase
VTEPETSGRGGVPRSHAVDVPDAADATPSVDPPRRARLIRSAAIFSVATGLSRLLGVVRESVAAYYFGTAGLVNAFTVAFQIPNLVRALVADAALSGAFVPVFSELLEKGDRKRAWRVASTIFWLVLLGLTAITALFILITPLVLRPFGTPDLDLTVGLARVLFPIVMLLGVSGIIVGILNTHDHFSVPALSPVLWNIAIIAGLAIGVPSVDSQSAGLYVYAGSIVVGTVVQLLLPVPWLRGLDGRLRLLIDWRDPAVKQVFRLMLPVTLALGLVNFNAVIDVWFASRLIDPELAPTAIDRAFRLYMLPQGIFSVAVTVVLFPLLSRLASRGEMASFGRALDSGLRQIGFLLIPAAAVSAVLAEPIVRLVYERGATTSSDTRVIAGALAAFSAGLVFNGWMLLLTRAYYSLQSNWKPTVIAVGSLALNALFDLAFYRLGIWGIPLATAVANMCGAAALLLLLRPRLAGGIPGRNTVGSVMRIVLASAILAGVAFSVWWPVDALLGRSFLGQVGSMALALTVGALAYLGICRLIGVREIEVLAGLRRSRPLNP